MAFNAGTILARLRLDDKQFSTGITKAKVQTQSLSAAMGVADKSMTTAMGPQKVRMIDRLRGSLNLTSVMMAGAMVGAAVMVGKAIHDMALKGAKLADMRGAFESLAASSGNSADSIVSDVRRISGALTKTEIIQAANSLELLGVGMENTARMTEIARAAGVALGKDTAYMLESIATGTARQSRLWLDNLGIIISIDEANQHYAKTLGKTANELTDMEKRAAFLNEVLNKGDVILEKVNLTAETNAEVLNNQTTMWKDLGDEIAIAAGNLAVWISKNATNAAALTRKGVGPPGVAYDDYIGPQGSARTLGQRTEVDAMRTAKLGAQQRIEIIKDSNRIVNEWINGSPTFNMMEDGGQVTGTPVMPLVSPMMQNVGIKGRDMPIVKPGSASWEPGAKPSGYQMGTQLGLGAIPNFAGAYEPIITQSEAANEALSETANRVVDLSGTFEGLGDAVSATFAMLITDSKNAGRAFFSSLTSSIGGVASRMGDLMLWTGIGLEALNTLHGAKAILAGLALKAVGGIMQGIASKNQPISSMPMGNYPSRGAPEEDDMRKGNVTFIVEGDFNGDPIWIDRLAEKLRIAGRDRGVEVVYNG